MKGTEGFSDVWILAEQTGGKIDEVSYELAARGLELRKQRGCSLKAMIFADHIDECDIRRFCTCGIDAMFFVKSCELKHFRIEPYASCMLDLIERHRPETVLAAATSMGRTLMPYVAIKADAGLTADCTVLEYEGGGGDLLQTRPAIGGNIMATIRTPSHRPQMATVRPKSTRPAKCYPELACRVYVEEPGKISTSRIEHVGMVPYEEELALQDADKVVVVGRGVKKAVNIEAARRFAEEIGAALGATRDVVDRGWLSYPHQVGLSGKTITPRLYVGLGVSGAIQHLAGMQTSGAIIAVNTDPDAQIFKVADLGIVGDVFEVLPALKEAVADVMGRGSSGGDVKQ